MLRVALFMVILSSVAVYLGLRMGPALGFGAWIFAAIALGIVMCFPLVLRFKDSESGAAKVLRWLIYFDMGFLSLLASLLILRDLTLLPFTWWKPELTEILFGEVSTSAILAVSLLGLAYGSAHAMSGPRIREIDIEVPNLPASLKGYRIAQLSDLHAGPTIGPAYVEDVVRKTKSLAPDMIVLTGDIADGNVEMFRATVEPLRELALKAPTYYVPGNHEYYWNGPEWIGVFESLGMKTLLNRHEIIRRGEHEILIAGVLDPAARMADPNARPDARAALGTGAGTSAYKILLSHHPGIARTAAAMGYDLQLSGHTHAGQFFPWTLVVPRVHEFSKGLAPCGKMWVYVNPGTGSWGPPLRLGSTPEITLLKLVEAAPLKTQLRTESTPRSSPPPEAVV